MAQKQHYEPKPIEIITHNLTAYCPERKLWITFRTIQARDKWLNSYKSHDTCLIRTINSQIHQAYDQLRKYENL